MNPLPKDLQHPTVESLLELSIAEDLYQSGYLENGDRPCTGDLTSMATLSPEAYLTGRIFAKAAGVIACLPLVEAVFIRIDPEIKFHAMVSDGERVIPGQDLATVKGYGVGLLAAERTALNFLGRLSGIASLTRMYVDAVEGTGAVILDTRKTAPGYRILDKYAVRMGGGQNHRMGLYDMVLIKNNHIDGAGGIQAAMEKVRQLYGHKYPVEIEVRTLGELKSALVFMPTRILLDNMDLETMRKAVEISNGRVPLEASGNVNLKTVRDIAETGVDFISSGALTHSAPTLDISMHLDFS
ncbi:MAG: carboxylating nicotinate-nucleotide diphosphorylase [Anaerolineales bacterium]|nr:carboxylating nicotinate-nucleotide diphosphorylase [Anaerolineales bacterium]